MRLALDEVQPSNPTVNGYEKILFTKSVKNVCTALVMLISFMHMLSNRG